MHGTWRRHLGRKWPVFAIGLLGILVVAPNAAGQAALKQYVPQGNPAGGTGGGHTLASPFPSPGPGTSKPIADDPGPGSDAGGRLPLGYPGTPWLWIILLILVAGGLIRGGTYVLKRRGLLSTG
jgi:hypothetical protein